MGLEKSDDLLWYMLPGSGETLRSLMENHYWSPLYRLWWQAMAFGCPNPLWRYFLSWGTIVVLAVLMPTLFRLRNGWLYALVLVSSPMLQVAPFVGLFAGTIALAGTCLVLRKAPRPSVTLTWCCVVCFSVSFCRSEFDALVFLTACCALVAMFVESRRAVAPYMGNWQRLTMIALVVLLCGCTGFTQTKARGARTGMAFAQHFNLRAKENGMFPATEESWKSDYAQKIFGVDTGRTAIDTTATIGQFFRANPGLFLKHVLTNLLDARTLIFAFLVAATLLLPWFWRRAHTLRPASMFVAVLALASLTDMSLIYPRGHYAMIALPSILIVCVQLLPRELSEPPLAVVVIISVALMLFVNVGLPRIKHEYPSSARMYLRQTQCERAIDLSAPMANAEAFDSAGIAVNLLSGRRTPVVPGALPAWADFKSWATRTRPAWIAEDTNLPARYGVSNAEFQTFMRATLGYTARVCQAQAHMTVYTPSPGR